MMAFVSKRVWSTRRKRSIAHGTERNGARIGIRFPRRYVSNSDGMLENGATRTTVRGVMPGSLSRQLSVLREFAREGNAPSSARVATRPAVTPVPRD